MKTRASGFTLIEVLVVVAILGVLMGLVSILISSSSRRTLKFQTEQLIRMVLPNSIAAYEQEFHRLPPQTLKELVKIDRWKNLSFGSANATNESAEILLVALRHPDFSKPFGDDESPVEHPFGNTDDDIFNMVPDGSDTADAREILDAYGNPIVYISKNHYGETFEVVNAEGETVQVRALKKPDGTWYNKTSYQLISLGANGKQDLEGGDDIVNFKREGE